MIKCGTAIAGMLFAAVALTAQKPVFKYPFATGPGLRPDVLTMPHYRSGKVAFLIKDAQKAELLLLNQAWATTAKFTHSQKPETTIYNTRAVPVGCIFAGDVVHNFLYDTEGRSSKTTENGRDAILLDKFNFTAGTTELSLKHALPEGEKLACAYTYNNIFFLISASPAGDALHVCYIDSSLNKTVRSFPIDFAALTGSMIRLEDALKTARVVQPGEADADAYTVPVKIFPGTDGLCIAFDYKLRNALIKVNPFNNQMTALTPEYSAFTGEGGQQVYTNVTDGRIFAVAASKSKLELGVFDLAGGKLIKKFESGKDDGGPAFGATLPAATTWSKGKNTSEKGLDNTGQMIKELLGGNGGLRVVKNEAGQYLITITAYKSSSPALPFPGISYPAEAVAGTTYAFHPANYGNRIAINTSFSAASFKAILSGSFDKVKQNLKPGPLEKIRDMFAQEEYQPHSVTLFTVNGGAFYGWYDAEGQQFTIRGIK